MLEEYASDLSSGVDKNAPSERTSPKSLGREYFLLTERSGVFSIKSIVLSPARPSPPVTEMAIPAPSSYVGTATLAGSPVVVVAGASCFGGFFWKYLSISSISPAEDLVLWSNFSKFLVLPSLPMSTDSAMNSFRDIPL